MTAPRSCPATFHAKLFDGTGLFDPTQGIATAPVHAELSATGGSLFYLRSGAISEGSEVLRVVLVDGVSRTPLAERHLVRGRDYEIDYAAGRILLARPLSLMGQQSFLQTLPPSHGFEPVLVVDASRLVLSAEAPKPFGGQVAVGFKDLLAPGGRGGRARGPGLFAPPGQRGMSRWGRSSSGRRARPARGSNFAPGDFARSDDGGLSFRSTAPTATSGSALTLHLKGPGLNERGSVDLAFRRRTAGFNDAWHQDAMGLHDLSLHLDQPVGAFRVAVVADDFKGRDPRPALIDQELSTRTVGGSVGWSTGPFSARLEARDVRLTAIDADSPPRRPAGGPRRG